MDFNGLPASFIHSFIRSILPCYYRYRHGGGSHYSHTGSSCDDTDPYCQLPDASREHSHRRPSSTTASPSPTSSSGTRSPATSPTSHSAGEGQPEKWKRRGRRRRRRRRWQWRSAGSDKGGVIRPHPAGGAGVPRPLQGPQQAARLRSDGVVDRAMSHSSCQPSVTRWAHAPPPKRTNTHTHTRGT